MVPTHLIPTPPVWLLSDYWSDTINPMLFSRYLFSSIKVFKVAVRIYDRLWGNSSKSWQNVETKYDGTKCVGTK